MKRIVACLALVVLGYKLNDWYWDYRARRIIRTVIDRVFSEKGERTEP